MSVEFVNAMQIIQTQIAAANLWEYVLITEPSTVQLDIVIALQISLEISVKHQFVLEEEIAMETVCVPLVYAFAV